MAITGVDAEGFLTFDIDTMTDEEIAFLVYRDITYSDGFVELFGSSCDEITESEGFLLLFSSDNDLVLTAA